MIDSLEAKIAVLETPGARRREVKYALWDSLALILGAVGIGLSFPPLCYVGAAGHLLAGFLNAPAKTFWLVGTLVSTAVWFAVEFGGVYLSMVYWHGYGAADAGNFVGGFAEQLAATAIVLGGIVAALIAQPGLMDQLREHLDRAAE
ncbi:hypothetical protein [Mesorhizobium sp.]|uniref:hypothetical protein n=1 Tax=Mesorhizobium sp. TaxID=1871066 RepID=UPI000FE61463|nr:hypothetical protein [Mesorhizobium sp.]RWD79737.1 MAG: hypothetical protein EOS48_21190 [Mesorhizobium sp.]